MTTPPSDLSTGLPCHAVTFPSGDHLTRLTFNKGSVCWEHIVSEERGSAEEHPLARTDADQPKRGGAMEVQRWTTGSAAFFPVRITFRVSQNAPNLGVNRCVTATRGAEPLAANLSSYRMGPTREGTYPTGLRCVARKFGLGFHPTVGADFLDRDEGLRTMNIAHPNQTETCEGCTFRNRFPKLAWITNTDR